jgi:hypothetical protein
MATELSSNMTERRHKADASNNRPQASENKKKIRKEFPAFFKPENMSPRK